MQTTAASRLPSLTGMRFLAAAMVFVFHTAISFAFANQTVGFAYLFFVSGLGSIAVSFFFVLSGFVLTWSAREHDSAPMFWRRRFFKIFPNHVVTFAAALVLMSIAGQAIRIPETVSNLFLVQSWVPRYNFVTSANGPAWTLACEVLFYLCFPLLFAALHRVKGNVLWVLAAATTAVIMVIPAISLAALPSTPAFPWGPASWVQIWFVNYFPVSRLFEFVLGILLARIVMSGKWIRLPLPVALGIGFVGYGVSLFVPTHFLYRYAAVMVIPLALIIAAGAAADLKGRKTVFAGRAMVFLGEVSFAFYLVHFLVLTYGHRAFGVSINPIGDVTGPQWSTPIAIAFFVASFAVSLLCAWALYALVERPIMRRWANPRVRPVPVGTPALARAAGPQADVDLVRSTP
jgi:peptidoglycan/LPS O-acetylase OafA/YrhL